MMTDHEVCTRLLMNREKLADMRLLEDDRPLEAGENEVVLRLRLFGLTTNNITYAAFGDAMKYWDFFPVNAAWGQMPVWGYAEVIDSAVAGIESGQRYFGYFPTATHLTVRPGKVGKHSFRDDSDHRQPLPEIYNWYQRTDGDDFHDARFEPLHAIYRPLFITAFSLADYLHDQQFFGAERILISSASSKTAYASAFCLKHLADIELVGLTSPNNLDFVERTGLYDRCLSYERLADLKDDIPTLYVDVAGNPGLTRQVHHHFGEQLKHDCTVGSAHSTEPTPPPRDLPGPKPQFFFAPNQIAKRHADWGVDEFNRRAREATMAFHDRVQHAGGDLLQIQVSQGLPSAKPIISDMLEGRVDPAEGHIIKP
ncbi:MAG: DUF2855 family protein [Wenzhouxiangella sp.]